MEKLIYVLGADDGADIGAHADSMRSEVVGQLKSAGASNIRLCIDDEHVAEATLQRQGEYTAKTWCIATMWVDSRTLSPDLIALLEPLASFVYGYAVAESMQIDHEFERDGSRVSGMNEVVLLRKLPGQSRTQWLDLWLNSHTQIAIETQSTFGYIQHLVGDVLTEDTPHFDAIVEENFPEAAKTSMEAFYDAVGDEEKFQKNLAAMIASVQRFIDLETIQVLPTSEYNF